MALTVAAMLLGQQDPLVEQSELAPPGQPQVAPPRAQEPQQQPAQPPQPAPPAIEQAPPPSGQVPAPAEAEGIRRTRERAGAGRPVAAFWFIN
jgi:hypothetical protein